jgi:hypothetical protein
MALEQLNRSVDFVSDTPPTAADANDGDTFLDTSLSPPRIKVFDGSAGAFVRPQAGVEFQNTAPRTDFFGQGGVSVSGSGYVISLQADLAGSATAEIDLSIDGSPVIGGIIVQNGSEDLAGSVGLLHRFESSFEAKLANTGGFGVVAYILD